MLKNNNLMEIGEYPSLFCSEIENSIVEKCRNALDTIKESDNPTESLEQLVLVFEALKKSTPSPGKGLEWARDLIYAYRDLGNLLRESLGEFYKSDKEKDENREFGNKIKEFESQF